MTRAQINEDISVFAPLSEFYARAELRLPAIERLEGVEVPQPYHRLLVHDGDMTPTLEQYHGEEIFLCVLDSRANGHALSREVVLVTRHTHRPVEFGAIQIHLDPFSPEAQQQIRQCHRPLGSILAECDLGHRSRPLAYFRISTDSIIREAFALPQSTQLYGRCNVLTDRHGRTLAQVVEILPPI